MRDRICVFGMGSYFASKKAYVVEKYEITSFIDNRVPNGETDICEGITVYNPNDWVDEIDETDVLLMAADWFGMWEQLKRLGVDDERIILSYDIKPFYDRTEEVLFENEINIGLEDKCIVISKGNTKSVVRGEEEYRDFFRRLYLNTDPVIGTIKNMGVKPSSTRFGLERGKPIDRVYIERFLDENKEKIRGTVIEIGDDRYMTRYSEHIDNPVIMHVNGWGGMKGNLATGEGIVDNYADCLICTQTLQHIYDIHSCIKNIYRLLKPGGTALITNGCIGELSLYDYHNWGEYWKFTDMTAERLFCECFEKDKVVVKYYGNVKAAMAFLYGMSSEEIPYDTFEYNDEQYPMIVTVCAEK